MKDVRNKKFKIKKGYLKDKEILIEGTLEDIYRCETDLLTAYFKHGNMAALIAINQGGYSPKDEPFCYGKVVNLGYVVSLSEL